MDDEPKKGSVPKSRIFLCTVLAVLLVLLAWDQAVRYQARSAYSKLDSILPSDEDFGTKSTIELPSQEKVHEIVGKAPRETENLNMEVRESFSWRGPFRSYVLYVAYARGVDNRLARVQLFKPFDAAE